MNQPKYIYIISDGTGETASQITKAALVHFAEQDVNITRCKNARTEQQVERLMREATEKRAFIVYTVVSKSMRKKIQQEASANGLFALDLLGPLLENFASYFGLENQGHEAGKLRLVDEKYFKRIEAIEFTVKHDDGKDLRGLEEADIILLGLSRTSKTPLSIFLSHKGWKVANIPIVKGVKLPEELFKANQKKIVALTIDHHKLSRIRRNRLEKFGQDPGSDYASEQKVIEEIAFAESLYKENRRWPVIDVTERALEETATEIVKIVAKRLGLKTDTIF